MTWLNFLFSFNGRINRRSLWLRFFLPLLAIAFVVAIAIPPLDFNKAIVPIELAAVWPAIAVGVKRCHDRNRSGWYLLIFLIPCVGLFWLMFELGFLSGTKGSNRFGEDPTAEFR